VALLFLVKDAIPTEPIWTAFISAAAELTLRRSVKPSRPAPPELLPELPLHTEGMARKCWPARNESWGFARAVIDEHKWPEYAGALLRKMCICVYFAAGSLSAVNASLLRARGEQGTALLGELVSFSRAVQYAMHGHAPASAISGRRSQRWLSSMCDT
jgi:hypothetical protein